MLELKNISKTFFPGTINEKKALRGVDLHMETGDFITIIGGNGAGKSTLLNSIAGVFPIDEGSITIDDVELTQMPEHQRARYIGRVFQDPMMGTAAGMMIEENLAIASRRGKRPGLSWALKEEERSHFRELLKELDLGLEDRLTARVGLLSGGQRQALTLLMAAMNHPKLLLLDEHTAALDPKRPKGPCPDAKSHCPGPSDKPHDYAQYAGCPAFWQPPRHDECRPHRCRCGRRRKKAADHPGPPESL